MILPERQYAEDAALILESMGLARAHGKLLAWLFVCDPPQQSSAELAEALDLSAGSVSTGTRLLENSRLIRRVAAPGRRGKVYELNPDGLIVASQDDRVRTFRQLMEKGIDVVGDQRTHRTARLRRARDFYAFMEREIPALIERFHAEYGEVGNG
jgi:DNA-binding transcriptional regulator GbsR (MarR family)